MSNNTVKGAREWLELVDRYLIANPQYEFAGLVRRDELGTNDLYLSTHYGIQVLISSETRGLTTTLRGKNVRALTADARPESYPCDSLIPRLKVWSR